MANPYPALITDANSETRVAGQIDFTDPANQPGGSSSVLVKGTPVVLNNADILSLPTTTLPEIIPAPGANKIAIPTLIVVRTALTVAYSGIDADGSDLGFYWDNGNSSVAWGNLITNQAAFSDASLTTLLTTTATPRAVLCTPNKHVVIAAGQAVGDVQQPNNDESVMVDTHLILFVTNGADFGGGDPANTMTIAPYYVTLDA